MTQTSVTTDNSVKFEGRCVYPGVPSETMSKVCEETAGIDFGRVVALGANTGKVRRLRSNQTTLTLDGDLVTSNVLAGNIIIDGVTNAYTETFASTHDATMELLRAEIQALDGILTATLEGGDNRVITVVADPESDVYFSTGAVTAGAGQAGVTLANTESGDLFGVSVYAEKQPDSSGNALYLDNEAVASGREIYIDVMSDDALAVGADVYVRFLAETGADKAAGMLMASSGLASNVTRAKIWANAEVYNGCAAGGIATIRVRV